MLIALLWITAASFFQGAGRLGRRSALTLHHHAAYQEIGHG